MTLRLALVLAVAGLFAPHARAQPTSAAGAPLTVAVHEAPPFAERTEGGVWDGLGVATAEDIAQRLGRPVRIVGAPSDSALALVTNGRADLALAPMTAEGEVAADYTAPFYAARLGVARPQMNRLTDVLGRFFSTTFFWIAAGLTVLLLVVGVMMWLIERRSDEGDLGGGFRGVWDGFWWAGVTMTTIGYGDTVPRSHGGRALALVWMLVSMAVTAALTAALVSALGLRQSGSGSGVSLPEDLQGERVGVVAGSPAARVLEGARVRAVPFATTDAALSALRADSLDTVAGSAPSLRDALSDDVSLVVQTTGVEFERWAFAVAEGSPLRDAASQAILARAQSSDWPATVRRYVGSP